MNLDKFESKLTRIGFARLLIDIMIMIVAAHFMHWHVFAGTFTFVIAAALVCDDVANIVCMSSKNMQ